MRLEFAASTTTPSARNVRGDPLSKFASRLVAALAFGAFGAFGVFALAPPAGAKPPLEAFGDVPTIWGAELSPDGKKVVFFNRMKGIDYLAIYDFNTRKQSLFAELSKVKAQDLRFVGNDYVVVLVSKTASVYGFRDKFENSQAFSVNLKTGKFVQLLAKTLGLFPAQIGLGRIIAVDPDGRHVFMPAFMGDGFTDPTLEVMRVDLETGLGTRAKGARGGTATIDWLMQADGQPLAREDFSERNQVHTITITEKSGGREIYRQESDQVSTSLVGVSAKGDALVLVDSGDSDFLSLYEMSIADGKISGPLMQKPNADVDGVMVDRNRVVLGVRYSGMLPSYGMFDEGLNADFEKLAATFVGSTVYLDSWSNDWSKLLLLVDGGPVPSRYVLFDRSTGKAAVIAQARPEIGPDDVGEVFTIEYKARDGLKIPGLMTWPAGSTNETRKNLPLIVLPHGGPEAYDSVGFDWLAQFLANEGYAVLQPNFRGSAGLGIEFRNAGLGEWGRKMQDDITDGVRAVAKMGWVDPERVCIVGASYGGYAALAGGALTPELYRCVVAIAPVSDLRVMLAYERERHGSKSSAYAYWRGQIGDPDKDREAIDAVSPKRHAADYKAPVLLLHGVDDTMVPSAQSSQMEDALQAKGKTVRYIKLKGDDHYFNSDESRRTLLTEMAAFIAQNIGAQNIGTQNIGPQKAEAK